MLSHGRGGLRARVRAYGARLGTAAREGALELVAPTRCAGCECPGALICAHCLDALELIDPRHACLRCGAPFGDVLCTECDADQARDGSRGGASAASGVAAFASGNGDAPDRCLAMAVFAGPLPRIVRAYKDGGEHRLAPLLAELLLDTAEHAEAVAPERYGGIVSDADAIVFVPDTAAAFQRRGFDHMEAIARPLARDAGVPLLDALVKHGAADQRALGRSDRRARAQGAYEVAEPVAGRRLLLVDDVITTGATIGAAASALRAAGAARVDALALARVW